MSNLEKYTANEKTKIVTFGLWSFYENDFGIGKGIYSWACSFGKELVAYVYQHSVREFEVHIKGYETDEIIESFTVDNLADALKKAEEVLI